jgi:hypothetical protein
MPIEPNRHRRNAEIDEVAVGELAPVRTDGIRPYTLLKPCDLSRKYVGVFDEQRAGELFATRCGWIANSSTPG